METHGKPETNFYRVVHSPEVAIRDRPWGRKIGAKKCGEVVKTSMRSVGADVGGWVKLQEVIDGKEGWMLLHGAKLNLGTLMRLVDRGELMSKVQRYHVCGEPSIGVHSLPGVNSPEVGRRANGRVVRADLELGKWVRLQADFRRGDSPNGELGEGWVPLHDPPHTAGVVLWPPSASWEGPEERIELARYWVVSPTGAAVRDRPWGRVVARKARGTLIRVDGKRDGWVRLEEDFLEGDQGSGVASYGFRCDAGTAAGMHVLEGWLLVDGSDVGLHKSLVPYNGEGEVPTAERITPAEEAERRLGALTVRIEAEKAEGEDWSIRRLANDASLPEEAAKSLASKGVHHLSDLVRVVSKGDFHDELKSLGVSKLGQRQRLAATVQPYWAALALKEQGNCHYKNSEFDEAITKYTSAIDVMPCKSIELALNCFNNRSACHQQMREPEQALQDALHVLKYDPRNSKALMRKQVNEQAMRGM